jgi:Tfp pilus assembly protein PilF
MSEVDAVSDRHTEVQSVTSRRWRGRHVVPFVVALAAALAGCATAPRQPPTVPLHDEAFGAPSKPIDPAEVFALSDEMRAFVDDVRRTKPTYVDPRRQLIKMLQLRGPQMLDYDATTTRNASEAFAVRAGNCLSLVIMTSALAHELGYSVTYQRVIVDEAWSRSADLYFVAGHVNLALTESPARLLGTRRIEPDLIVDFVPQVEGRLPRSVPIPERTIVAMYMNNRAAESVAQGHLDDAYWYAREAVRQDPTFLAGANTLGIVYLRRGLADPSVLVFEELLRREPDNVNFVGNQVTALRRAGRTADADALAARLAKLEPVPPFHWFNAGMAAMQARDYAKARDLFEREIRREPNYHEFHFWLAQAEFALGNVERARRQLEQAMEDSTTPREHDIYAAKLDKLRSLRAQ